MKKILINLLLSAVLLSVIGWIMPGMYIKGFGTAIIAALILGLVNAFIKPVISLLALPLTIITLGLFSLVINAFMLLFVSHIVSGFYISSFVTGLLASIVLSLLNLVFIKDNHWIE